MVRVISAHHFKSQDVTTSQETCASCTAGDFLLLASLLFLDLLTILIDLASHCLYIIVFLRLIIVIIILLRDSLDIV